MRPNVYVYPSEETGGVVFGTSLMRPESAFAARLPRAFDFLPAAVIRQVAQHISDNMDLPEPVRVFIGWAYPLIGRECSWYHSREKIENHLRITYFCSRVSNDI